MTRNPVRTAVTVGASVLVVVASVALGLRLWLGAYAPLKALSSGYAPGPGIGADVQPVTGSGGRPVFFPALRRSHTFDTAVTLHNGGHFSVTVAGLDAPKPSAAPWIGPTELLATTSGTASADPSELLPFRQLRLSPGDNAIVVVRFALRCKGATTGDPDTFAQQIRLRFSYLSIFTRTQTVRLPFAVTLRCVGGPPATP